MCDVVVAVVAAAAVGVVAPIAERESPQWMWGVERLGYSLSLGQLGPLVVQMEYVGLHQVVELAVQQVQAVV